MGEEAADRIRRDRGPPDILTAFLLTPAAGQALAAGAIRVLRMQPPRPHDAFIVAAQRTLTLRDVRAGIVRPLRARARRNRRSMQKEILSILEEAAVDRSSMAEQLNALRRRLGARMTLRDIHRAIEEGRV